jgi:hypothetical protein
LPRSIAVLINFFMDGFPLWRFGDHALALDAV